jgi:hypothetical protein
VRPLITLIPGPMSKPPRPEPDTAGAIMAMKARARGPRRKSPIYEWLAARHDELAAAFRKTPPSWTALADYLGQGGVMNVDGALPTPSAVRTSWLRVEADLARKRGRRASPASPAPAAGQGFAPTSDHDENLPDFSKPVR